MSGTWRLRATRKQNGSLNSAHAILADVILDLALILNPSLILLGGEVGNHPVLLHELETLLEGSEFPVVRVALGTLGSSAVLWGAACTALEPAIHRATAGCSAADLIDSSPGPEAHRTTDAEKLWTVSALGMKL